MLPTQDYKGDAHNYSKIHLSIPFGTSMLPSSYNIKKELELILKEVFF